MEEIITNITIESGFVCMMDILGFSQFIKNNDHEHVKKFYNLLLGNNVDLSASHGKLIQELDPNGDTKLSADLENAKLNSIVFSDSVVFWTDTISNSDFSNICWCAKSLLKASLLTGLPMRGAITIGSLTVQHRMFEGKMKNFQSMLEI